MFLTFFKIRAWSAISLHGSGCIYVAPLVTNVGLGFTYVEIFSFVKLKSYDIRIVIPYCQPSVKSFWMNNNGWAFIKFCQMTNSWRMCDWFQENHTFFAYLAHRHGESTFGHSHGHAGSFWKANLKSIKNGFPLKHWRPQEQLHNDSKTSPDTFALPQKPFPIYTSKTIPELIIGDWLTFGEYKMQLHAAILLKLLLLFSTLLFGLVQESEAMVSCVQFKTDLNSSNWRFYLQLVLPCWPYNLQMFSAQARARTRAIFEYLLRHLPASETSRKVVVTIHGKPFSSGPYNSKDTIDATIHRLPHQALIAKMLN